MSIFIDFHWISLIFIEFHWFSLKFIDFLLIFIDFQLLFENVFEYVGDLDSPESIPEMIQRFWNIQKWILDEKIRRNCAAEALPTRNSHRDRPFWKLSCYVGEYPGFRNTKKRNYIVSFFLWRHFLNKNPAVFCTCLLATLSISWRARGAASAAQDDCYSLGVAYSEKSKASGAAPSPLITLRGLWQSPSALGATAKGFGLEWVVTKLSTIALARQGGGAVAEECATVEPPRADGDRQRPCKVTRDVRLLPGLWWRSIRNTISHRNHSVALARFQGPPEGPERPQKPCTKNGRGNVATKKNETIWC